MWRGHVSAFITESDSADHPGRNADRPQDGHQGARLACPAAPFGAQHGQGVAGRVAGARRSEVGDVAVQGFQCPVETLGVPDDLPGLLLNLGHVALDHLRRGQIGQRLGGDRLKRKRVLGQHGPHLGDLDGVGVANLVRRGRRVRDPPMPPQVDRVGLLPVTDAGCVGSSRDNALPAVRQRQQHADMGARLHRGQAELNAHIPVGVGRRQNRILNGGSAYARNRRVGLGRTRHEHQDQQGQQDQGGSRHPRVTSA